MKHNKLINMAMFFYSVYPKHVSKFPIRNLFLFIAICFILLATPMVWAYPFSDTRQTKCYYNTTEITCPSPGEAFYGQDAQYNFAPQRSYTNSMPHLGNALLDNVSSWTMVRDNVTGLIWEMKTDDDLENRKLSESYNGLKNRKDGGIL